MLRTSMMIILLILAHTGGSAFGAETAQRKAYLVDIEGAIGPATADYFIQTLDKAEEANLAMLIIRMDTPGGLDTSMREIVKRIIAASIPVVTYVAPGGARAASAGTYILYASHVAAMAPATNLGAATPVSLGGLPEKTSETQMAEDQKGATEDGETALPAGAMERKLVNDSAAYLKSLAELRGRDSVWAEKAVRQGASLSAREALEQGVIDLIAADLDTLLLKLNGLQIKLPQGLITLATDDLVIEVIEPDWQNRLLSIISNPNLAYILMLVGIYGLIYEFANPGSILPGSAGAICLLLALYAFQVLPVNYAGVGLFLLGLTLIVAEAFMPSFGALGVGGVIAFFIGSLILIDTEQPGFGISLPLIIGVSLGSAFLLFMVVGMALKSHRRPVVSGSEEMLAGRGQVVDGFDREGEIRVHSEIWHARSELPLHKDQWVRITGRRGLTLEVTPLDEEE